MLSSPILFKLLLIKMSLHINVSLETPDEYRVQEISYDGQEKYITPLSMSENLTRLAHCIDFSKYPSENDPNGDVNEESLEKEESKEIPPPQVSLWPWDSVRNKIKNALTEVTVLLDVINIAKEKKYLVLDPVSQSPLEVKPIHSLISKKKALAAAATILLNGVEKMKQAKADASRNNAFDFHSELLTMRQNWRLKKLGNTILGDLSYRSAGSRFPHLGTFEVVKTEQSTSSTNLSPFRPISLKVKVPSDLEGVSYIHVSVQKDTETIASGDLSFPLPHSAASSLESSWQQKLENAQNVLFCKEIFYQLAREAVQVQFPIPTLVVGNQIIATLFPTIQLSIGLCHNTFQSKKRKIESLESGKQTTVTKREHKPVLEHSLHQLLRELHYNYLHHPMSHPTTVTLGMSRKRYFAGPEAYDRHTLVESCKSETILEQIIAQSQHVVLRLKTMQTIDTLAAEIKDPLIVAHWLSLNSPVKSSVKINIVNYGYESLCRTAFVIHVGTKSLKAICRDGRTFNMSYETNELQYLIMSQVSQHQVHAVHTLAKFMGWKALSFTNNCGAGRVEPTGTASALVISSPNGERMISIRHGPSTGAQVSISSSPRDQDFYPTSLVKDRKWHNINASFKELDLNKIEGKTIVNKMEYLMSCATDN